MPYFDLHCHPGLKTLFLPQDGSQFSVWNTLSAAKLFGDILSSQSSLQQISVTREVPLICITLHPPESGMLDQFVIIAGAITIFSQFMDLARVRDMFTGVDGYQSVFAEEFANLTAGPRPGDNIPAGVGVKFLQNWADYDPTDAGTVHVVFNIEGGHALYSHGDQPGTAQEATDNLRAFLDKNFLTLYITPTHLTPNQFINHAYGNKILTKGPLLPQGLGITPDGKTLIDYAYAQGLLIDVKHMSLVSRLQFYHIHDQYYPGKPIIASHAGLTGCNAFNGNDPAALFLGWSTDQHHKGSYVQVNGTNPAGLIAGTTFYGLSINLFDEDVVAILKSNGLIGISMDVRILGGKDNGQEVQSDYLSATEYDILTLPDAACIAKISAMADALWTGAAPAPAPIVPVPDDPSFSLAVAAETQEIFTSGAPLAVGPLSQVHARLIANHLLQIYFISDNYGLPLPWDKVCIGSDFDGLIEAVDCCKNVTALGNMAAALVPELRAGAAARNWDLGMDPQQIVDQFCYTNAYNFLNQHFNQP